MEPELASFSIRSKVEFEPKGAANDLRTCNSRSKALGSDDVRSKAHRKGAYDGRKVLGRKWQVRLAFLEVLHRRRGVWTSLDVTCTFLFDEIRQHLFFHLQLLQLIGNELS
mmetsp:Transcript_7543/g.26917  ORF Transcript_7543/g.26917 Transcript_7543/m.26917 type:complete len:111 (-) Transcript_7543:196-528(-)